MPKREESDIFIDCDKNHTLKRLLVQSVGAMRL